MSASACRGSWAPLVWGSLFVTLPGCAAPIVHFTVSPRRTCPGGRAQLTWDTRGGARLDARPPLADLGPMSPHGALSVRVEQTTVFTLSARTCWSSSYAEQEVDVLTDAVIAGNATECQGSVVIARGEPEAGAWSPDAHLQLVRNLEQRPLGVEHASVKVQLGAGEETAQFRGARVDGPWTFTTGLLASEECGNAKRPPQNHFRVSAALDCSEGDRR